CVIFFATDGVYRFDGAGATKISSAFGETLDKSYENVVGAYFDGHAYFNVKTKGESERRILRIDPHRGDFCFLKGIDAADIMLAAGTTEYSLLVHDGTKNKPFRISGGNAGILGVNTECFWKSKETDFGLPIKNKRLSEIKFSANAPVEVKVTVDGKTSEYAVTARFGGIKKIKPNARGDRFSVSFKSVGTEVKVSDAELTFKYYL
ncbi:MAG TPA: hypothetical protein DDW54_01180, partial [Clostridiales bacterium]|nr:hypothetical protein [Clostridiales bacterium]